MIKLNGSRFTAATPENLKEQPEVQAIAYAVGRQIEKLLAYADGARTYAAIQSVPERVLDLLAVELRTPAYDENYSVKVKRALIEGSLLFYTQMGTPAAVENIIETIFGTGYITEWWEYGGRITSKHIPPTRRSPPTTWRSSGGSWVLSSAFPRGWTKSCWNSPRNSRKSI